MKRAREQKLEKKIQVNKKIILDISFLASLSAGVWFLTLQVKEYIILLWLP